MLNELITFITLGFTFILLFRITAPCEKATYEVGIQRYGILSHFNIRGHNVNGTEHSKNEAIPNRHISLYYSTNAVKISSTSELVNLSSFISSVGGNLGLFVGFSFLNCLLSSYDLSYRMVSKKQNNEQNSLTNSTKASKSNCEPDVEYVAIDRIRIISGQIV